MNQIINFYGGSGSGKTTLAAKLALHIAAVRKENVILVCGDTDTPTLPILFPENSKIKDKSLGNIIEAINLNEEVVYNNAVGLKNNCPLLVLGYNLLDSAYNYAQVDKMQWIELFTLLSAIADNVIIDNPTNIVKNPFSEAAFSVADKNVNVIPGDFTSLIYEKTAQVVLQKTASNINKATNIKVLRPDIDRKCQPINEIINYQRPAVTVPYSLSVLKQFYGGRIFTPSDDKTFDDSIADLFTCIQKA